MVRYNGLVWSNIAVLNYYHPIHMILGNCELTRLNMCLYFEDFVKLDVVPSVYNMRVAARIMMGIQIHIMMYLTLL